MALFMYPHALTGTLSASSGRAIRFNTMTLPAYSFVLGLIALLGLMAIAAGVKVGDAAGRGAAAGACGRFPTGSPASASPRSRSARWCRRR